MQAVRSLVGILAVVLAGSAAAADDTSKDWTEVASSPATPAMPLPTRQFVQWSSLDIAGDLRTVWISDEVTRAPGESGFRSVRQRTEFDCRNITFRVLENKAYSGEFGTGAELAAPAAPQEVTVAERSTRATTLLRLVCRRPK